MKVRALIRIPPRRHIREVNRDDPLRFYYVPLIGYFYRKRLALGLSLLGAMLGGKKAGRLLEVGYGSGILLPDLSGMCEELYGVDIHTSVDQVNEMLRLEAVTAELETGSVTHLPYEPEFFDVLMCFSVLEHLRPHQLDTAVREIERVLRPGGIAVVGVPVESRMMTLLFSLIGFADIHHHHFSDHETVLRVLQGRLSVQAIKTLPSWLPVRLCLYRVCLCTKEE